PGPARPAPPCRRWRGCRGWCRAASGPEGFASPHLTCGVFWFGGQHEHNQSDRRTQAARPERMARPDRPRDDPVGAAGTLPRRRRERCDREPDHLRQGARELGRLRRARDQAAGPRPGPRVDRLGPADRGRAGGGRRHAPGLRPRARRGRLRQHRGLAGDRWRHRANDCGGARPAAADRKTERDGQDPRHPGGPAGIANSKLAYEMFTQLHSGARWDRLRAEGASVQRCLWASTSTKNPRYRDVMYVEELIGPATVDTMPPATFEAFSDHGRVQLTLQKDVEGARRVLDELAISGVDLAA